MGDRCRNADHRMMRSGKAEDALCAARSVGVPGRRLRRAIGIMRAQFESRGALVGIRRQRESAERDKQSLHGNGVRQDNSN
jgi:hypothetical protein